MLIRDAELFGRSVDVRCRDGSIVEIEDRISSRAAGEIEIDAGGGALIPGLHDHHLHLFSLAASLDSIACGPPDVSSAAELARSLDDAAPRDGWLRGTSYFESVAGDLDRARLDAMHSEHALRIQHRSGSMWFLNSRAIESLGLDDPGRESSDIERSSGIERDASGRATGRLFRCDDWLRERLPNSGPPELDAVGLFLARCGVTRVTDATPGNGREAASLFRSAQASGALPQRLRLMGGAEISNESETRMFVIGELKILLDESALPDFDHVVSQIRDAHASGRGVAVHTVTRTEMHFALAAIGAAGARAGDRLEHASVAPPDAMKEIRSLGLAIVTQPNFIAERGDAYRTDVEARDLPHLYRVRSWLEESIPLAGGTDAPFGHADPWRAIGAAVRRETASGAVLGEHERVTPELALRLFFDGYSTGTTRAIESHPIAVGRPADLCLLEATWRDVRLDPSSAYVRTTICDGRIIWHAEH